MEKLCNILNQPPKAAAYIKGSEKYPDIFGRAAFYSIGSSVLVRAEITGLPQSEDKCANPVFAFHIHSGGECSGNTEDPFKNSGMHYNPYGCEHPYHAGDMPPLFGVNGNALLIFMTDRFSIEEIIGKTVIIHRKPDDFAKQPSGNSGEKIACGVIERLL